MRLQRQDLRSWLNPRSKLLPQDLSSLLQSGKLLGRVHTSRTTALHPLRMLINLGSLDASPLCNQPLSTPENALVVGALHKVLPLNFKFLLTFALHNTIPLEQGPRNEVIFVSMLLTDLIHVRLLVGKLVKLSLLTLVLLVFYVPVHFLLLTQTCQASKEGDLMKLIFMTLLPRYHLPKHS